MISISGDYGSEKSDQVVGRLHTRLDHLFAKRLRRKYSQKIKEFVFVLRVSGRIMNYRLEGLGRTFYSKKHEEMRAEIGIPLKAWERKSPADIRRYFADQMRAAFASLKQRLAKIDEHADIETLESDFESCIIQFLKR